MIGIELALALLSKPCVSEVRYEPRGQIVTMCEVEKQGPHRPYWWRADLMEEPKATPVKVATKKREKRKKKRRRRG